MKILINTPVLSKLAGVSSHYRGLRPYFSNDVRYFCIGAPKIRTLFFFWYYAKFLLTLLSYRPDVVVVNPSMAPTAWKRDSVYMKLAWMFGIQTVCFFHGFHVVEMEQKKSQIVRVLNRCSLIFVLANEFRQILLDWGVKTPVKLTTTQVNEDLIKCSNGNKVKSEVKNILYLARVTRAKGIFVALDVFSRLQKKYPLLQFTVVGTGADLTQAKSYAEDKEIHNIVFTGGLWGNDVANAYIHADCYLFTSYHEGLPTSVLEAMSFGLPVVTRPVGGLKDFFEEGKMGYLVDSDKAEDYMEAMSLLMEQPTLVSDMSYHNYNYAHQHFAASKIAISLEQTIREVCVSDNFLKKYE